VAEGSPTVRRRELGALLRGLREKKELSVKDVTDRLLCSPSKVSRLETGERGATLRDVRDLCDLYGVGGGAERDRLMTLAREGKQRGWWQTFDLPSSYSTYVGLEAEAIQIKDFDTGVMPGLLQTTDYARALYQDPLPEAGGREMTDDVIEQRVKARLRRQRLLDQTDRPFDFWAILDEAALRRVIGSSKIMHEQLEHVIKMSGMRNVKVQILTFGSGAHPALDSTFNILEFSKLDRDVVYVEGLQGLMFLEKQDEIARYQDTFAKLSRMALSPEESASYISQVSDSHARSSRENYRLRPRRTHLPPHSARG
jgi:transcriptional regulator with XRE-family HTH domain